MVRDLIRDFAVIHAIAESTKISLVLLLGSPQLFLLPLGLQVFMAVKSTEAVPGSALNPVVIIY